MKKDSMSNDIFDVMLKNAVFEQFDNEYKIMVKQTESMVIEDYSAEFKKVIRRLYKKENLRVINHKLMKIGKRAAIVILSLLAVTTALFTTVEAFRTRVFNFFFNLKGSYSAINLVTDDIFNINSVIPDDWYGAYTISNLPKGYEVESIEYRSDFLVCRLINHEKYIILKQRRIGESTETVNADTFETVRIDEFEGRLFYNEECYTLFWKNDNMQFVLFSNDKKEKAINFVKNLKFIKKL